MFVVRRESGLARIAVGQNLDPTVWILGLVANETAVAVDSGALTAVPRTALRSYDLANGHMINETAMPGFPTLEVRKQKQSHPVSPHTRIVSSCPRQAA